MTLRRAFFSCGESEAAARLLSGVDDDMTSWYGCVSWNHASIDLTTAQRAPRHTPWPTRKRDGIHRSCPTEPNPITSHDALYAHDICNHLDKHPYAIEIVLQFDPLVCAVSLLMHPRRRPIIYKGDANIRVPTPITPGRCQPTYRALCCTFPRAHTPPLASRASGTGVPHLSRRSIQA